MTFKGAASSKDSAPFIMPIWHYKKLLLCTLWKCKRGNRKPCDATQITIGVVSPVVFHLLDVTVGCEAYYIEVGDSSLRANPLAANEGYESHWGTAIGFHLAIKFHESIIADCAVRYRLWSFTNHLATTVGAVKG